jgi:hypothetical protein
VNIAKKWREAKKTKVVISIVPIVITALFLVLKAITLQTNNITFVYPKVIDVYESSTGLVINLNRPVIFIRRAFASPLAEKVNVITCDWSKECVEAYIEEVGGDDKVFISWAKYVSAHEGGYKSQFDQANYKDIHVTASGEVFVGSFGQFQFGEPTYKSNCEESKNWKMDWRAQTRCAKKLFDQGSYKSHWLNNTNGWLDQL